MYQVSDANKEESDKFVNDFLNLAVDNEILKIASEVNNNINVPFSSTTNYTVNKFISDPTSVTLFNVDNQGKFINSKIEKLATNNPKFRNYLLKHCLELIIQLGYIAQSNKFANNFTDDATKSAYYIAISSFVKNYLMSNSFFNIRNNAIGILSYIDKNYLPLEIIGISSSLLNPVLRSLFPEVAISYIAVETNSNNSSLVNGNLAYFVSDKINNLELLGMDNSSSSELLEQYLNYNNSTNFVVNEITGNADNDEEIKIDGLWFKTIKSFNAPSSFGINLIDLQYDALSSVLGEQDLKVAPMQLPRFYLAKVNFAYLSANKKKIYDGEIPTDKPFLKTETDNFINRFDDSYIINVNGIKYIIVGEETTVDYMYPVIDENNLQVDTKHQALVYVNNNGFNRIKDAYAGNIIKENLLVKAPENVNVDQLKSQIIKIVDNSIVNTNNLQRVFKNNETDIINPERALRITTITNIIKVILVATIALVLLFSFLVIVSIIFIIKRYINSKNKVLGILIAQGYTPNQIASSLFVFAFITALIGGILGYIVGNRLQFEVLDTFSGYWTLPKNTLIFNPIAAIFTFITPCFIICSIIYLITITTLRIKPLDLINDNNSIPKHKLFAIYTNKIRKYNVKTRFSFILSYIGIWKLISFAISIVLVTTASLFGVTNRGVFNDTINLTYQNRNYKYKMNLQTPTAEAGLIKGYDNSNLKDLIYTPIGTAAEIQTTLYNFVAPGISPVINNKNSNGNPGVLDPHVTSQFSLDLVIASGYSLNPWDLAYQSMPDSQRTKIDSIRDQIGNELEQSQNNRIIDNKTYIFTNSPDNKNMIIYANKDNLNDVKNYFAYYKAFAEKTGHFVYKKWNGDSYETIRVTTDLRNEYRDFIVNGYDYIQKQIDLETNNPSLINDQKYINDYFISFSGVVFNKKTDEKYTYIDTDKGKIDGYRKDSKFISLKDLKGNDLLKELYDYKVENDIYPLVINDVARKKHKWSIGEVVTFRINNEVHRYLDKITNYKRNLEVKFKIIGINSTYINEELITTQEIANKLTGLSSIVPKELKNTDFIPFNGILSNQDNPVQITGSASLYSPSNYWPIITSFEANESNAKDIYNQLFNVENGLFIHNLVNNGFSLNDAQKQLAIFLDSSMNLANANAEKAYNNGLESPRELINKFANIYNNSLYTLLSSSLDAKDIEVSFVSKIGTTVNNVTIGIIWVTIIISLTILIIISTIIITENKRNIAIWAILGYKESEKLKMFFSIFIPFIVLAIIISIPATLLLIYLFNIFMLQAGSIVLMISLSFPQIISVVLAVFAIFICTALLTWYSIGKIKPIQLLKD
ncbi:FtsX-like permease family protein [Mycoplasmopsis meleagridis]|uniref:ABC transporter permease n=1 Tax=Mycoplasmopsis meleagridis TaxID=29561 RepID=UPI003A8420A5